MTHDKLEGCSAHKKAVEIVQLKKITAVKKIQQYLQNQSLKWIFIHRWLVF